MARNPERTGLSCCGLHFPSLQFVIRCRASLVVGLALLAAQAALAQPANNHFTNAWALAGTSVTTNGNSSQPSNANKEPGEPNHAGFVGGRSVWFQWVAPTNGPVRVSTAGSGFNTLLAVYTGSAVNALTQVAANDNFPGQGNNTSRVDFNAQQGTEYRIAIDCRSGGGAPLNARIHPATGRFSWRPNRDQPSTNRFTVIMTDAGSPPLLDARSFTVVVKDYYEVTLGETVLRSGQSGSVPIGLFASAGLTHLRWVVQHDGRLAGWSLEPVSPSIASVSAIPTNAVTLDFDALPGLAFQGTQTLARLHFDVPAGQNSSFAPLLPGEPSSIAQDPARTPSALLNSGRVVIVGGQPLLEAGITAGGERILTLYDEPGQTLSIERSTRLGSEADWTPWRSVTLDGVNEMKIMPDTEAQTVFYRARR